MIILRATACTNEIIIKRRNSIHTCLLLVVVSMRYEHAVPPYYCHYCANQSLIRCRNNGSFFPIVGTFEYQKQCL